MSPREPPWKSSLIREEREAKAVQIGGENTELPVSPGGIILYVEPPPPQIDQLPPGTRCMSPGCTRQLAFS